MSERVVPPGWYGNGTQRRGCGEEGTRGYTRPGFRCQRRDNFPHPARIVIAVLVP